MSQNVTFCARAPAPRPTPGAGPSRARHWPLNEAPVGRGLVSAPKSARTLCRGPPVFRTGRTSGQGMRSGHEQQTTTHMSEGKPAPQERFGRRPAPGRRALARAGVASRRRDRGAADGRARAHQRADRHRPHRPRRPARAARRGRAGAPGRHDRPAADALRLRPRAPVARTAAAGRGAQERARTGRAKPRRAASPSSPRSSRPT